MFPAVQVQSLSTGLPRKSLKYFILNDTLVQVWRRGGDIGVHITNVLFGSLSLGGVVPYIVGSNTLALKISSKTLFIFYAEENKRKKKSGHSKERSKERRKKRSSERNTRSIVSSDSDSDSDTDSSGKKANIILPALLSSFTS